MKWMLSLLLLAVSGLPLAAELPPKKYDLGSGSSSGDVVRGPRTIVATNLNILRYRYRFNSAVTFSQAPDIWSRLTELAAPPTPEKGPPPPPKSPPPPPPPPPVPETLATRITDSNVLKHIRDARRLELEVSQRAREVESIADAVDTGHATFNEYVSQANTSTRAVKAAGKALTDFLRSTGSDARQAVSGIDGVLGYRDGETPQGETTFMVGIAAAWPEAGKVADLARTTAANQVKLDAQSGSFPAFASAQSKAIGGLSRDLQADLASSPAEVKALVQNELDDLEQVSVQLDAASTKLTDAAATNAKVKAGLPDLQQGSQPQLDFTAARDQLITWQKRMEVVRSQLTRDPQGATSLSRHADCDFAFARTKDTTITLVAEDQLPGSPVSPQTILSVTVECTSPFTVSAGIAFSTIRDREYAIQTVADPQGSTTTKSVFGAVSKSGVHPLPLGMVHARVWEPNEWLSLHASFGIAGNLQSQSSGGSGAEFLIGPSLALFRTMFFTPGLYLGRETSLGGGFREGDPVPSSITSPPLQTAFRTAFGFAITFTKP